MTDLERAPALERRGHVFVLNLGSGENRFHPDWMDAVHSCFDEVLAHEGPTGLVTTASGKFWSVGADLAWGMEHPSEMNWYLSTVQRLLARTLSLPVPTVAALQGHTYGAGALLSLCHDHRVMRSDRGFLCFPGVSIGASYSPGVFALVRSRLSPPVAHDALVSGRRYGGEDAKASGLIDETAAEDDVVTAAVRRAESLSSTRGPILGEIKEGLHRDALDALAVPITGFENKDMPRQL